MELNKVPSLLTFVMQILLHGWADSSLTWNVIKIHCKLYSAKWNIKPLKSAKKHSMINPICYEIHYIFDGRISHHITVCTMYDENGEKGASECILYAKLVQ
jgi:hypothetical protein